MKNGEKKHWKNYAFSTDSIYSVNQYDELCVRVQGDLVQIWPDYPSMTEQGLDMSANDARKVAKAILMMLDGGV